MEGEAMVGRKRGAQWIVLPDLYKGFHRFQNILILKMATVMSAETVETF
jgi:hypothetical protein